MHIETQFSIFMVNKPGVLAQVLNKFADAKINIIALTMMDSVEHGVMRVVTGSPDKTRRILQDILRERLELTETRAFTLADGRARRWRKGVEAMLRSEIERTLREAEPLGPAWVFPDGKRQERHLAYLCAASLWGEDLVESCLETAGQHLELGHRNRWREFVIVVPPPR